MNSSVQSKKKQQKKLDIIQTKMKESCDMWTSNVEVAACLNSDFVI